jgi:hypothetical protein
MAIDGETSDTLRQLLEGILFGVRVEGGQGFGCVGG